MISFSSVKPFYLKNGIMVSHYQADLLNAIDYYPFGAFIKYG
jgi:hypothetical protein